MSYQLSTKQTLAWDRLEDDITTEVMYGGAAGGGKSLLGCVWHIWRRTKYPGTRGLIGRSKLKALEESTLVTLFSVASGMGYVAGRDYKYNAQKNFIVWRNGSKTILKDLFLYPADPDFQSLGSTEYTDVFIDESTEVTKKAFDIVKSRIRYKLHENGLIPKIYLTGNPQPGWVKERFVSNEHGERIRLKETQAFIAATVMDNPDPDFVKLYTKQLNELDSDYDKARLLYGDWEVEREVLRPFAHAYDESKHVGKTKLLPASQLVVVVDFNIDPFCANIFQIFRKDGLPAVEQVSEIEVMQGSIPELGDRIKQELGNRLTSAYISGDATGNQRRIDRRDHASLFKQLMVHLKLSPSQFKIAPNPPHGISRDQVNYFLKHFPHFVIDDSCQGTRRDMRTVQVDLTNHIVKRNRNDLSQRADFIDNVRYLVNTFLRKDLSRHQKSGRWF